MEEESVPETYDEDLTKMEEHGWDEQLENKEEHLELVEL